MHTCKCCNKQYDSTKDKVDDGFCSFNCWESVNCGVPEINEEVMELTEGINLL